MPEWHDLPRELQDARQRCGFDLLKVMTNRQIIPSLPGVRVGELMPRTAQILDRLAVLRGVHTDNPSHPGSSYEMFTGVLHSRGKGRDDAVDSRSEFPNYAAFPRDFPVDPVDLTATMFHALGISPELEVRDALNRPFPLSRGRVLERLF
jgi:hypothetical protein